MTKTKRSTKRSLLMCGLVLLVCVTMLIGSTFAWFTDSVTSANNKIVAGNLDVQLLMYNGSEYVDISDSTAPIFGEGSIATANNAETLWEPGKTQVAYLAIKNNGNLALKYTVGLDVQNVSKNLYEVMKYAITPDAQGTAPLTSWDAAAAKNVVVGTQSVSGNVDLGVGATHYFALSIHMDEEAGNDYQGGKVNFDINVMATQNTVESDSFNNMYDEGADYDGEISSAASLSAAFANGGTYKLIGDVAVDDIVVIPEGKEVVLNLNGNTISKTIDSGVVVRNYGTLTLAGEGTIDGTIGNYAIRTEAGSNLTINEGIVVDGGFGAVSCFGGTLTINGGDFSNEESNTTHYVLYATNNSTVVINGGTFTFGADQYAGANGSPILASTNGSTIEINGGTFDATGGSALCYNANNIVIKGGTFKNRAYNTYGGNIEGKLADGYAVVANNDGSYTVIKGAVVSNATGLSNALASGKDVMLAGNVAVSAPTVMKGGSLDGQGYTIDGSALSYNNADCAITTKGGKISNLTIVGKSSSGGTRALGSGSTGDYVLSEDLYIDNVTLKSNFYGINGSGVAGTSVYVTNSTVYGWHSFSGIDMFSFDNCTLGMGTGENECYDGYLVVYGNTSFKDCTFEGVFDMGARMNNNTGMVEGAGSVVTFENCYYDGVKVTADNFVDFFYYGPGDARDFGYLMANFTIVVDGVVVDNSAY